MSAEPPFTLAYQRTHFLTQLPVRFLYTPAHVWLAHLPDGRWRVGFTTFATRTLGEVVDHAFQVTPGSVIQAGQNLGWIEGFKAIVDLAAACTGRFVTGNPALQERVGLVNEEPHGAGWLYEAEGERDPHCMDVHGYRDLLDRTIDRLLAQRRE